MLHKDWAAAAAWPLLGHLQGSTPHFSNSSASHQSQRRADTPSNGWGPAVGLGPTQSQILTTSTIIYPGLAPANQVGGLFCWLGISNGTGDLIQSIVGQYPPGESQCQGDGRDSNWCISSEVYGLAKGENYPVQYIGDMETLTYKPENGVLVNYTLVDKDSYLWTQTMHDATTGILLATYNKTCGPMTGWGTAVECQECTGTIDTQWFRNSTIVLDSPDPTFINTLSMSDNAWSSPMTTKDGGKTWTIDEINIPPQTPFVPKNAASSSNKAVCPTSNKCIAALATQDRQTDTIRALCNEINSAALPPKQPQSIANVCGNNMDQLKKACDCLPAQRNVACTMSKGSTYTSASGHQWMVECDMNRPGYNIGTKTVPSNTLGGCIELCEQTDYCVNVRKLGNTCFMKYYVAGQTQSWGSMKGARRLDIPFTN
ncbi:hypothetical protein AAFC00_004440 [Neodothiora populina]|uniref:Apple domain-containing protein n=1 Tax=Neodothiora populina TaxID=2781224 RepID=A0ABR3P3D4_9PEZI